ncbi:MAG: DNA primase [Clostridia bacterium]|nr:DNA primase [Clostridia bacterium]
MAGRISQAQIEEIIDRNNIVSVVGEYVHLKRSGANYMGLCPFHNEKTPSFSVNESKRLFKCFGCGKGGGVVQFIMLAENLDYVGSLEFLARRAGIEIKYENGKSENDDKLKLKNDILSLNEKAQAFFKDGLARSKEAQNYLAQRGLDQETVNKFGLGFAPDDWEQLTKICTYGPLGVSPELMVSAGLALKRDNGTCYDRFRNRVMFPIFDETGRIIAFGGRVMDKSLPKYMNSPETAAYNKGSHLYALNFARKSGSKQVIIVEGYMDAIALHQKGITSAVASLGTALTIGQARLLKRYFEEVIIGYDSDSAGQTATVRGMEILAAQGLRVRILKLGVVDSEVKDPDEFLRKHSAEDFMVCVEKAETLVNFKIEIAARRFPPEKESELPDFIRQTVKIIAAEPSASVRAVNIASVSKKYGIDEVSLKEDVEAAASGDAPLINTERVQGAYKRVQYRKGEENAAQSPELSPDGKRLDRLEKRMIIYLADNPSDIPAYIDKCREEFCFEDNKNLANILHSWYINGYAVKRETLLVDCSSKLSSELTDEFEQVGSMTTAAELLKNLKKFRFKYEYGLLTENLRSARTPEEKSAAMKKLNELIRSSRT